MTKTTLLMILAATGCSTTASTSQGLDEALDSAPQLPEKVYDFAPRALAEMVPPLAPTSDKGQLRAAVYPLKQAFSRCTEGTSGEIALAVRITAEVGQPAVLKSVELSYPDASAAACLREAAGAIDVSGLHVNESVIYIVHMPLVVGANS